ncbi:MAG: ribulose-phosphate 3-epimerase [Bacteroidetes bacterium]|nr:ribulose-phosphate 3-epimerase [Bacteroidota bacterium]MBU1721144.1 ribulose-phosphate 3-epimerase [Bacteroidota bacterium]
MKNRKLLIAPSVLSCDFTKMGDEIQMINQSDADWIHIDVMDGVFVPNISLGIPVIKAIKKVAEKPLDVHLMIVDPDRFLTDFKNAGADILTVHYEACNHLNRTLNKIRELGMKAGVVLNPHTPVSLLENTLEQCDLVLLMSVNPGFGGQKFIPDVLEKAKQLRLMIDSRNPSTLIEVDGGVDFSNAKLLFEAGVDILVAGNTVFSAKDPNEAIARLKKS